MFTSLQLAILLFLIYYFGIILGYRAYLLYKNTGINTVKEKDRGSLEGFVERMFLCCLLLMVIIGINYIFLESNYKYLIPIHFLETIIVGQVGIVLSFFGLTFTFVSQLQMGNSWRLGYNKAEKTTLIKNGLFKYSRNPIYLGLIIAFLGFFLMAPNAASLCFLVLSYVALEVKIRLEEVYLSDEHGDEYLTFKNDVRRWI